MTVPAIRSDKVLINLRDKPDVAVVRIIGFENADYLLRYRCSRCGADGRGEASQCWNCSIPIRDAVTGFTVKLADNGVEARGVVTFLLSLWNPTVLGCRVRDWGSSTQLEVSMKYQLSVLEWALFSTLFVAAAVFVYGHSDFWYHRLVAFSLFLFPIIFRFIRKKQERDLSEFATKHLLQVFPDATIEHLGNPFK